MADIARRMGVSPGSLYNYVESKEALFYLVVDCGFGIEPFEEPPTLPVPTPKPGATLKRIAERARTAAAMPKLEAASRLKRARDPRAELASVVVELFEMIMRSRRAVTLLEQSAVDLPEVGELFFLGIRRGLFARLARYIEARVRARQFRKVRSLDASARLIVETVNWFARNRLRDPDARNIDDATALATVVDFIVNALVPERARTRAIDRY